MSTITESVTVNAPLQTAYNQWTQFEDFPRFMEGVESVTQIDDTHLRWVAEIGGQRREWEAEISRQEPDQRIAWQAVDGNGPDGVVTFAPSGADETRVTVEMTYEPEGVTEQVGSAIGLDSRKVKGDLERFKELVESRGVESGAWRGQVREGQNGG